MPPQNNQVQQHDVNIGTLIASGARAAVRNYPKVSAAYVIGLSVLLFASGFAVDQATKRIYDTQMAKVEALEYGALGKAFDKKQASYDHYYYSKGWFSCDSTCNNNYRRYLDAEEKFNVVAAERDRLESEARKTVGLFSEYGVADCRRQFWAAWERGKEVAKRMSWWDALFIGMSSRRDEDGIATLLRLLGQVLMNFTIGLFVHIFSFLYNLIWFVRSYQAGIGGAIFFTLAACAAVAMFMTYILGMFAVFGGGAYALVKFGRGDPALNNNGGRGGQQRYDRGNTYNRRVQHGNNYGNRY